MVVRRVLPFLAALTLLLAACGARGVSIVQAHHGRELRCDKRYVRAERVRRDLWVSRGCGFEAEWMCRDGRCELQDLRAYGTSAP